MRLRIYDPRILALDLRHRRLGYAVFEGHRTLLDWGVRIYPANGDAETALAVKRLNALVELFTPEVIVVKKERWEQSNTDSGVTPVIKAVSMVATSRSIPIQLVPQTDLMAAFNPLGYHTREEIADALTRIFPELTWHLPPKRKVWQSQHPRMTVFDAIALGFTYWQARGIESVTSS